MALVFFVVRSDATRAVGFGCFHFGWVRESTFSFSGADYAAAVESTLKNLLGVNSVGVSFPTKFRQSRWEVSGPIPNLTELGGPVPQTQFGTVAFTLKVPAEYCKTIGRPGQQWLEGRPIRVHIDYGFSMPVATVAIDTAGLTDGPSDAVILVREFLRHELNEKQSELALECLGPSPAHLDVFLIPEMPDAGDEALLWRSGHSVRGYETLNISYNKTALDPDRAVAALRRRVSSELDLMYSCYQIERFRRKQWNDLDSAVRQLVSWQGASNLRGRIARATKQSRMLTSALISLTELQANSVLMKAHLDDRARHLYRDGTSPLLATTVGSALESRTNYPTEETAALLDRFEARRQTNRQLVSGLAGAVVGAVAALLASA